MLPLVHCLRSVCLGGLSQLLPLEVGHLLPLRGLLVLSSGRPAPGDLEQTSG